LENDSKYEKVCAICEIIRENTVKHCIICNKCILRYDHHCPWINGCIGIGNHNIFLCLLLTLVFDYAICIKYAGYSILWLVNYAGIDICIGNEKFICEFNFMNGEVRKFVIYAVLIGIFVYFLLGFALTTYF